MKCNSSPRRDRFGRFAFTVSCLLLGFGAGRAQAVDYTYVGPDGGKWGDAANWSPAGGPPNSTSDNARIDPRTGPNATDISVDASDFTFAVDNLVVGGQPDTKKVNLKTAAFWTAKGVFLGASGTINGDKLNTFVTVSNTSSVDGTFIAGPNSTLNLPQGEAPPPLTIGPSGRLWFFGPGEKFIHGGLINNQGTILVDGEQGQNRTWWDHGSVINNTGFFNITGNACVHDFGFGAPFVFNNLPGGVLSMDAGPNLNTLHGFFNNTGTFNLLSGDIDTDGDWNWGGTTNLSPGVAWCPIAGRLRIVDATFTGNTGTIVNEGAAISLEGNGTFPTYVQETGSCTLGGGNYSCGAFPFTLESGPFNGGGTLETSLFDNESPEGVSPSGVLEIDGQYRQSAGASLWYSWTSATPPPVAPRDAMTNSRLNVSGTATLAGTLNLTLANNYVPVSGDSITLMTYASHTGTFTTVNLPTLGAGLTGKLDYGATALTFTVLAAPTISGFTPASGVAGTVITLTGANFIGATSVKVNGTAAVFTVVSAASITATVPAAATSGKLSVTTPGGTATSTTSFTVLPKPVIGGITPTHGLVGITVTINGTNLTNTTTAVPTVKFGAVAATAVTVVSAGQVKAVVPNGAITAPISVTTSGGTSTTGFNFTVDLPPAPTIGSFSPTTGPIGTVVTITGTNLSGATAVKFNGIVGTALTLISATSVKATVPPGAATGKVSVTTSGGTATSTATFTATASLPPTVSAFSPGTGKAGTVVTVTGTNLLGASSVKFNATAASVFSVTSATSLSATVPAGAATGKISVITPGGTAVSATSFTVPLVPVITTFSPISGPAGTTEVTITGKNFTGATLVKFNNKATASLTLISATQLKATVPVGTVTGPIAVTTGAGVSADTGKFQVLAPPVITTFSPASGKVGATITISGSNFTGLKELKFSSNKQPAIVSITDTQIVAKVPVGAVTGPISVATTRFPTLVPTKGNFFVLPGAPPRASGVALSGATANVGTQTVTLTFSGALEAASATAADHYSATRNGAPIAIEYVAYDATRRSVTLGLGDIAAGDSIVVRWSDVIDAGGLAVAGATGAVSTR